MKPRHLALLLLATVLSAGSVWTASQSSAQPSDAGAEEVDERPTLWIIGDSTVRLNGAQGKGWGEVISPYFDTDRLQIKNRAIGGRSSRTFLTEGRWADILEEAKAGDFVLMQFGHNDPIAPDNKDRPRGTIRGTGDEYVDIIHPQTNDPERVFTFGWYMRQYVRYAQMKGMTPIVVSYIPRAPRRGETANPELSSYALWAKEVAEQEDAAFVDLYGRVASEYVKLEAEQPHVVKETMFVEGDRDYTHTSEAGAIFNAERLIEGLRDLDGTAGELATYLKDDPATRPGR